MDEERLDGFAQVRFLYEPGELEGGTQRGKDPIWSLKIYDLKRSIISPNQPILYYLENGPRRGFVREELQVVPENTENPPDTIL